ncbi:MAG: energy-coupling factor transporter transmembrane protein EcfT [Bacilli bacterium]|nr:energy-coupling factor transporter transmembrane protein EcfT [Bacilli bacterium]
MAKITLGRYSPYTSFIHRMDPRNKIFCLIALMVAVFFQYSTWEITFIMGGILFLIVLIMMFISHVSFKQLLLSLKSLWFVVLFLLLINAIIPPKDASMIAFSINGFNIYFEAIFQSLKIVLRLVLMVSTTMVLTSTTKPLDLTYALEWYLTPLKLIKFPAHEVAMTISIALRFIPTLLDETDRIMKAQASRGVDFKHGKMSSRFKAIISLIVPLFISAFQRSEELADAMEARGYDPKAKRTRYHKMRFHLSDLFAFIFCGAVMAGVIIVSHYGFTLNTDHFIPWLCIAGCGILTYIILLGIYDVESRKAIQ